MDTLNTLASLDQLGTFDQFKKLDQLNTLYTFDKFGTFDQFNTVDHLDTFKFGYVGFVGYKR